MVAETCVAADTAGMAAPLAVVVAHAAPGGRPKVVDERLVESLAGLMYEVGATRSNRVRRGATLSARVGAGSASGGLLMHGR